MSAGDGCSQGYVTVFDQGQNPGVPLRQKVLLFSERHLSSHEAPPEALQAAQQRFYVRGCTLKVNLPDLLGAFFTV